MKDENHLIISIDAEKAFDKIHHPFLIKTLTQVEIAGTCLNAIKATYEKPTALIILCGPKPQAIPLRMRTHRMSTFTSLIQYSAGSAHHSNQPRRK